MSHRLKGVMGTPLAGFTQTEYLPHELERWKPGIVADFEMECKGSTPAAHAYSAGVAVIAIVNMIRGRYAA